MNTSNFIIAIVVIIFTSCSLRNNQDNNPDINQDINKENLREYLSQSFNIDMDTLTTKLVLINYIGCKPCINKYLDYLTSLHPESMKSFMYIIPVATYEEFSQNCPVASSSSVMIDSLNTIYKKNIQIDGLSVYNIVKGEILEVKTIKLRNISDDDLQNFWMKWENKRF